MIKKVLKKRSNKLANKLAKETANFIAIIIYINTLVCIQWRVSKIKIKIQDYCNEKWYTY